MANKKTIDQLDREIDRYWRKLNYAMHQITIRRELIRKIRKNQIKQPPPPGKKVMLSHATPEMVADFDDVIPSFGSTPAIGG